MMQRDIQMTNRHILCSGTRQRHHCHKRPMIYKDVVQASSPAWLSFIAILWQCFLWVSSLLCSYVKDFSCPRVAWLLLYLHVGVLSGQQSVDDPNWEHQCAPKICLLILVWVAEKMHTLCHPFFFHWRTHINCAYKSKESYKEWARRIIALGQNLREVS